MNRFSSVTIGGLSLAMLLCGSMMLLAADEPPSPAKPDALAPQAMLARIVQLEATVAQLQKALSCMVAHGRGLYENRHLRGIHHQIVPSTG
jgi:hypothetical protein